MNVTNLRYGQLTCKGKRVEFGFDVMEFGFDVIEFGMTRLEHVTIVEATPLTLPTKASKWVCLLFFLFHPLRKSDKVRLAAAR